MLNQSFTTIEIPAQASGTPGCSFIVATDNCVVFSREITKHNSLLLKSGYLEDSIAWGGILDSAGNWKRASVDFGDAPTPDLREIVVRLLQELT